MLGRFVAKDGLTKVRVVAAMQTDVSRWESNRVALLSCSRMV
jgi:hypothetical protein